MTAMKWKKYTLATTTEAEDLVSAFLQDAGIDGVEIEDNIPLSDKDTKGMFIDILPELPPDTGEARVTFYLDPDDHPEEKLAAAKKALEELRQFTDIGPCVITEGETEDRDWINNWKQFFHPFFVDDILIKPTWEDVPEGAGGKLLIQIDPGTAFGTGSHETTQLCIRQLEKYIRQIRENGTLPGMEPPADGRIRVLDVGTGSGILGITALKLGAAEVFATDLDENAVEAVGENLAVNDIDPAVFTTVRGNIIDDEAVQEAAGDEKYDIAAANILAPVIILLQKEVFRHLKHGGVLITSGIIDEKEEAVRKAFEENPEFEILEVNHQGEWVNITARRR